MIEVIENEAQVEILEAHEIPIDQNKYCDEMTKKMNDYRENKIEHKGKTPHEIQIFL